MNKKNCIEGEIFSEMIDLNGEKYEHIGFRDKDGKFIEQLEKLLGKKVKICLEVLE